MQRGQRARRRHRPRAGVADAPGQLRDAQRVTTQAGQAHSRLTNALARQQVVAGDGHPARGATLAAELASHTLQGSRSDATVSGVPVEKRPQLTQGHAGVGHASLRIRLSHALQRQRQAGIELHQPAHVHTHAPERHVSGFAARRHRQTGHAQAVQVAGRKGRTNELLHWRIAERSGAGRRDLGRRSQHGLHRAEVHQPRLACAVDHDVLRRHVAVDHRRRQAVQVVEHLQDLDQPGQHLAFVHGALAGDHLGQGLAVDELLDQDHAVGRVLAAQHEVVDIVWDVRVIQAAKDRGLALEELPTLPLLDAVEVQRLQRTLKAIGLAPDEPRGAEAALSEHPFQAPGMFWTGQDVTGLVFEAHGSLRVRSDDVTCCGPN